MLLNSCCLVGYDVSQLVADDAFAGVRIVLLKWRTCWTCWALRTVLVSPTTPREAPAIELGR